MYDLETWGKQEHRQNSSYDVTRNTGRLSQYIHTLGRDGKHPGTQLELKPEKNKYNKQANKIEQEVTNAETRTKTH